MSDFAYLSNVYIAIYRPTVSKQAITPSQSQTGRMVCSVDTPSLCALLPAVTAANYQPSTTTTTSS